MFRSTQPRPLCFLGTPVAAPRADGSRGAPRATLVVLALVVLPAACGPGHGKPAVVPDAAAEDGAAPPASDARHDTSGALDADVATCRSPGAPIDHLAFSTDGRWLALGLHDGGVLVIELGGVSVGRVRASDRDRPVARIALTEDGSTLAAATDGRVDLFATADGRHLRRFEVAAGANVSLKFSDAPAPLLLAGFAPAVIPADNVLVWRISDGILVASLRGSPLGTFTYADAAVLLLDEARGGFDVVSFGGRQLRRATFPQALARTAFAADGAFLAGVLDAGGPAERLAIMSVADDAFVWRSTEPSRSTRQLLFLENPSRLIQLSDRARVYDHADGRVLTTLPALDQAAVVAVSPDGTSVAAVDASGQVVLVSTTDGTVRPACP